MKRSVFSFMSSVVVLHKKWHDIKVRTVIFDMKILAGRGGGSAGRAVAF